MIERWKEWSVSQVDCAAILRELDSLERLADRNIMMFSQVKCEVLHMGKNNPMYQYAGNQLGKSCPERRDPGGHQDDNVPPVYPCSKAAQQSPGLHQAEVPAG